MSLADRLRQRRTALGYTQVQFGALVGLPGDWISLLERGQWRRPLSSRMQQRLAQALGCPVRALGLLAGRPCPLPLPPTAQDRQSVGARLAQRRCALGLTQTALAARLPVHPSVICRWEQGRVRPSPQMRTRLAQVLACRADTFVDHPSARGQTLPDLGPRRL
jgi:transcriptional regulator with XRE-family HTH domain